MAVRARVLVAGLLAAAVAAPALALPDPTARYRLGIGYGPGESISGGDIGYHKFIAGGAKAQLEMTLAPVAAINAMVSNTDPLTGIYASGFLSYGYAVNFTAASGLVFNDLNIVTVTGLAYLATTNGGDITANVNDGLVAFSCANGFGADCGTTNFGFNDLADSYTETDLLNGTSQYTLFGSLILNANLNAAATLPNQLSLAQLYLDPQISLYSSFADGAGASNILVELSPGVANSSGPPVALPAVPEPASWAMLVAGFGMMGTALRRRRQVEGHVAAG